jgi:hypothetical protein
MIIHPGARAPFEAYRTLKPTILDGSLPLLATFLLSPFRRVRPNLGLETPGAVRT